MMKDLICETCFMKITNQCYTIKKQKPPFYLAIKTKKH